MKKLTVAVLTLALVAGIAMAGKVSAIEKDLLTPGKKFTLKELVELAPAGPVEKYTHAEVHGVHARNAAVIQALFNEQAKLDEKRDWFDTNFVNAFNAQQELNDKMMARIEALEERLEECASKELRRLVIPEYPKVETLPIPGTTVP